jgi:hypothetical protein
MRRETGLAEICFEWLLTGAKANWEVSARTKRVAGYLIIEISGYIY